MATTIAHLSGFPLQYPSDGRLRIQSINRTMLPGFAPSTLRDVSVEFNFNPLFDLSSPASAFSFFSARLAAVDSRVDTDIAHRIATFALDQARSRSWFYGLSLSVVLETMYEFEEPRSQAVGADFLDGHLISNDTSVRDYYEALDNYLFDLMIRPFASFASTGVDHGNEFEDDSVGMSEREISLLKKEVVTGDEDDECCCICLEGFMRGAVITPLSPCSHRFHNGCIVQWLRNNRTCPICRGRCTVGVS